MMLRCICMYISPYGYMTGTCGLGCDAAGRDGSSLVAAYTWKGIVQRYIPSASSRHSILASFLISPTVSSPDG